MNSSSRLDVDDRLEGLTRRRVSRLLGIGNINPFIGVEEHQHPWSVNKSQEFDFPLLRVWDCYSGSAPDKDGRMMSRSPNETLETEQARRSSLTTHLDHREWVPTPYISFTRSPGAVKKLADWRFERRGKQTLTVVDPASRFRNGLPILEVLAEMQHYHIPDPYGKGSIYYINHYVCLWEVTANEIVGHWDWKELAKNTYWYEEVIMPEFRAFGSRETTDRIRASTFDMSTVMESLPIASKSTDSNIVSFEDLDGPDDYDLGNNDEIDSDEEAEEANLNDNLMKMIEGLW